MNSLTSAIIAIVVIYVVVAPAVNAVTDPYVCSYEQSMAFKRSSEWCTPELDNAMYKRHYDEYQRLECECMGGTLYNNECTYGAPLGRNDFKKPEHLACDAMPCAIKLLEARRALARLRTQYGTKVYCAHESSVINTRIDQAVTNAGQSLHGCQALMCSLGATWTASGSNNATCPNHALVQATCDAIVKYEKAHINDYSIDIGAVVADTSVSVANSGSDQCLMKSSGLFLSGLNGKQSAMVRTCESALGENKGFQTAVNNISNDLCDGTDSYHYPTKQMACDGMSCALHRLYRKRDAMVLAAELEPHKCGALARTVLSNINAAVNASVANITTCKALLCELRWYSCTDEAVLRATCLAIYKNASSVPTDSGRMINGADSTDSGSNWGHLGSGVSVFFGVGIALSFVFAVLTHRRRQQLQESSHRRRDGEHDCAVVDKSDEEVLSPYTKKLIVEDSDEIPMPCSASYEICFECE
eukprot:PhM_4_TR18469/c2_g1_i1/m.77272